MRKILLSFIILCPAAAMAQGFIPRYPNCGVLWGNANFDQNASPHPGIYILKDNERHEKLNRGGFKFNDKESAAGVRAGCILTLYKNDYFREVLQIIEGPTVVTNANGSLYYNDEASSAECICDEF
jgi:hypothetical protein